MSIAFQKIKVKIDKLLLEAEQEAQKRGVDIAAPEFDSLLEKLKDKLLEDRGINLVEYETWENSVNPEEDLVLSVAENIKNKRIQGEEIIKEEIKNLDVKSAKTTEQWIKKIENTNIEIDQLKRKTTEEILGLRNDIAIAKKEKQQVVKTIETIKEVENEKVEELQKDLLALQSTNTYIHEQMDKARKEVADLLPKGFKEQWDLLTGGGLADALHKHDVRQRRGYGGIDEQTARKIIASMVLGGLQSHKRVLALSAGSATPAINTDLYDVIHITAQSAAITSFTSGLTGTPIDGDVLRISITDDGTARALTWGALFESSTTTLPTTTVLSTRLDVGFLWNTETSKWRCVAVA